LQQILLGEAEPGPKKPVQVCEFNFLAACFGAGVVHIMGYFNAIEACGSLHSGELVPLSKIWGGFHAGLALPRETGLATHSVLQYIW
jgi:hypothetical protein